jgi:Sec-independent protein translocase protein TatA
MDFFGLGGSELLLLVFLGGVLLGPRRLAKLVREARLFAGRVRALAYNVTQELDREINLLEAAERKPNPSSEPEAPGPNGDGNKAGLPEAYRRFREEFPEEGKLPEKTGVSAPTPSDARTTTDPATRISASSPTDHRLTSGR